MNFSCRTFYKTIMHQRYAVLLIFLLSIFALSTAIVYQYVLGYVPCYLCIYERIPYIPIIIGAAYCLFLRYNKYWIFTLYISILVAIGLSAYHSGIERGIFSPTEHCKTLINYDMDFDFLRFAMQTSEMGDCSVAAVKIIGLSMTEWNLILNLMFLVLMIVRSKK